MNRDQFQADRGEMKDYAGLSGAVEPWAQTMLRAFVTAGAAYLDHKEPQWFTKIDTSTFDIAESSFCILGQAKGGFTSGLREIMASNGLLPDHPMGQAAFLAALMPHELQRETLTVEEQQARDERYAAIQTLRRALAWCPSEEEPISSSFFDPEFVFGFNFHTAWTLRPYGYATSAVWSVLQEEWLYQIHLRRGDLRRPLPGATEAKVAALDEELSIAQRLSVYQVDQINKLLSVSGLCLSTDGSQRVVLAPDL